MVLVANKADLEGERVVSFQDGEGLAQELKVQWNSAEERGSICHNSRVANFIPSLPPFPLSLSPSSPCLADQVC